MRRCCLGDVEGDIQHYETAWELSKQRYPRAMRSLGAHYFQKGEFLKATECWKLALDINPGYPKTWFTCGCTYMRLQMWTEAARCCTRSLAYEENAEAYGNLASVHVQLKQWKEARVCSAEACRLSHDNFRMSACHSLWSEGVPVRRYGLA